MVNDKTEQLLKKYIDKLNSIKTLDGLEELSKELSSSEETRWNIALMITLIPLIEQKISELASEAHHIPDYHNQLLLCKTDHDVIELISMISNDKDLDLETIKGLISFVVKHKDNVLAGRVQRVDLGDLTGAELVNKLMNVFDGDQNTVAEALTEMGFDEYGIHESDPRYNNSGIRDSVQYSAKATPSKYDAKAKARKRIERVERKVKRSERRTSLNQDILYKLTSYNNYHPGLRFGELLMRVGVVPRGHVKYKVNECEESNQVSKRVNGGY